MNRLFVYGSLKQGFHNAGYLASASYLGDFETQNIYTMYNFGNYPGVTAQGNSAIFGEVYAVDQIQFAAIDKLEGYPDFYQREIIRTAYGEAWIYIVNASLCINKKTVLSGQWLAQ